MTTTNSSVPNLDEMTVSELQEFCGVTLSPPRFAHGVLYRLPSTGITQLANKLFPSKPDRYLVITIDVLQYAAHKAILLECQRLGLDTEGLAHEKLCDFIYNRLPDYARW